jgi:uncharacterized protein (TIGR03067 family)
MRSLVFTLLLACGLMPQVQEDLAKEDLARLQGKWKITSEFIEGIETQPKLLKKASFTFKADKIVKGTSKPGSIIKLDPTKKPATIDMTHADSGFVSLGIYEIDGDMLKLCYTDFTNEPTERPKKFEPTKTNRYVMLRRK